MTSALKPYYSVQANGLLLHFATGKISTIAFQQMIKSAWVVYGFVKVWTGKYIHSGCQMMKVKKSRDRAPTQIGAALASLFSASECSLNDGALVDEHLSIY